MDIIENRDQWLANYQEWAERYRQTNDPDWKNYQRPRNSEAPAGPAIDLSRSRLLLITSAGGYLPASQQPFDAANPFGDYTMRVFPTATPLNDLAYAHDHYDHTAVDEDAQVLVPLRHLEDLVTAGVIGELTPSVVSFSGYQPDASRVVDELIPEILGVAKAEQAQAALLVPS